MKYVFAIIAALITIVYFFTSGKELSFMPVFICALLFMCVGGIIGNIFEIPHTMPTQPVSDLQRRFIALGDMKGKDLMDINKTVSRYFVEIEEYALPDRSDSGFLVTWQDDKYQMKIVFDDNKKCLHILSEKVL